MFGLLAAGVVLLGVFVIYEQHRRQAPLVAPSLLKNGTYISGIAVALAFFGAFSGLLLVVSLFCQLGAKTRHSEPRGHHDIRSNQRAGPSVAGERLQKS